MPGFDGAGPRGAGPMTGWGRGFCSPAGAGYRPGFGRAFGFRRGAGRGRGFGRLFGPRAFFPASRLQFVPTYDYGYPIKPEEEIEVLKADANSMRSVLDEINRRIEELRKDSSE
ncbi:MAG: DUF5320 domain-containing protein [Pseudomonadota bacterium]